MATHCPYPTKAHIGVDAKRGLVPNAASQQAYVCGPTQFMRDMTEYLVSIGVPAGQIHTESFEF